MFVGIEIHQYNWSVTDDPSVAMKCQNPIFLDSMDKKSALAELELILSDRFSSGLPSGIERTVDHCWNDQISISEPIAENIESAFKYVEENGGRIQIKDRWNTDASNNIPEHMHAKVDRINITKLMSKKGRDMILLAKNRVLRHNYIMEVINEKKWKHRAKAEIKKQKSGKIMARPLQLLVGNMTADLSQGLEQFGYGKISFTIEQRKDNYAKAIATIEKIARDFKIDKGLWTRVDLAKSVLAHKISSELRRVLNRVVKNGVPIT